MKESERNFEQGESEYFHTNLGLLNRKQKVPRLTCDMFLIWKDSGILRLGSAPKTDGKGQRIKL
jgi:hypothetical protein